MTSSDLALVMVGTTTVVLSLHSSGDVPLRGAPLDHHHRRKVGKYCFSGWPQGSSKRQWIQFPASVGRRSTAVMQRLPRTSRVLSRLSDSVIAAWFKRRAEGRRAVSGWLTPNNPAIVVRTMLALIREDRAH